MAASLSLTMTIKIIAHNNNSTAKQKLSKKVPMTKIASSIAHHRIVFLPTRKEVFISRKGS